MAQEIEIEYKNLITKAEFEQLLHEYPFPEHAISQTNYYLETSEFALKEKGCALRIREKGTHYVLTLKEPHKQGLLETHDTLTKQEANHILKHGTIKEQNVAARLHAMHIPLSSLVYCGKLTTERRETELDDALLVLDHSMYNDIHDYELEVEAPTQTIGIHVFEKLLREQRIQKRETPNKIKRFFASLPPWRINGLSL